MKRSRMEHYPMITIADIWAARPVVMEAAIRTPLVRLQLPDAPASAPEIFLKLENLQPIGSFKLRGAQNAMRSAAPEALARGVLAASAGNMAQGVAYVARRLGVPATIIAPDIAPETKQRAGQLPHAREDRCAADAIHERRRVGDVGRRTRGERR
jgi:threonine dehydratase